MSMRSLEAAILNELKQIAKNPKLKQKDIIEWQTGKGLKVHDDETLFFLPELFISVAVKLPTRDKAK